jgi:hypothetical protein
MRFHHGKAIITPCFGEILPTGPPTVASFLPALVHTYNAGLSFALLCCCCWGDSHSPNTALLSNFTMQYSFSIFHHCMRPLARQPCPASLPSSLAWQSCPAVLPGSLARQSCPAVLPCSLARQPFPANNKTLRF